MNIRVAVIRTAVVLGILVAPVVGSNAASPARGVTASAAVVPASAPAVTAEVSAFAAESWDPEAIGGVDLEVFSLALQAARTAVDRGDATEPRTLTVIDFSRPSTQARMWVYDLSSRALLFTELVSHGRGSGRAIATTFSNAPESYKSSIGLYRTAEPYFGKHGYSLRLDGLEPGVNDRARERAIVMHGAEYVNPATAKAQGYLGRSLGCPALRPEITRQVIDAVKDGGLLFAYYPDADWLRTSRYLAGE